MPPTGRRSAFGRAEVRNWPVIGWLAARNDTMPALATANGPPRRELARIVRDSIVAVVTPTATRGDRQEHPP